LDTEADVPSVIQSTIEQGVQDSFSPSPNHGEIKAGEYPKPTSTAAHGEHEMIGTANDNDNIPRDEQDATPQMHLIDRQDLVGCAFLLDEQDDGQRYRAKIIECVTDHNARNQADPKHIRFCCTVNDDQYEDIITYNKLMDYIQKNAENDYGASSVSLDIRDLYAQVTRTTQVQCTTCK